MLVERYQQLWLAVREVSEAWEELRITVREDRPVGEAIMLVERLGDELDDGLATLQGARGAVQSALEAPDDLRAAGRALTMAHELVVRAVDGYWKGLGSIDRRRELDSLGRRHGGEWAAWARSVEDAQARLPSRLTTIAEELGRAWSELVDRAASGSTSLTAKSIGQQITVTRAERCSAD
jgi:hypothetical protein